MVIKLIIFDFDGTLADTSHDILLALNRLLKSFNHPLLDFEEVKKHIGQGFTPFIRSIARKEKLDDPNFEEEVFNLFQKLYDEKLIEKTKLYDGVEKFLNDFQKFPASKIGIVSNKPEYQIRLILKELKIQETHLVQIFGGDTFDVKKPNPKPLIEMMKLAGVTSDETVMIGDSQADVDAAIAAGTHFIGVTFGYNTIETLQNFGAYRFIHHFDDLIVQLESIFL